jgi:hypothetical protein
MGYIAQQRKGLPPKSDTLSTGSNNWLREHRIPEHRMWTNAEGQALLNLFQNAYWRMVWIIQETMNARHLSIFVGEKRVDLHSMNFVFRLLRWIRNKGRFGLYPLRWQILGSPAAVIFEDKDLWDSGLHHSRDTLTLKSWIERYNHLEFTVPLDKVYGLLGLSSDAGRVTVDYRKSPELVYNEVLELACE